MSAGAYIKGFLSHPSHSGAQFDPLDGLRGLAAMLVVFAHMSRGGVHLHPSLNFVEFGKPGVFLFFVLSSFLLTQQLVGRPGAELLSPRAWSLYFTRRLLRIYPLFTVALLAGLSTPFMTKALFGPRPVSFLEHLTLQQGAKIFWAIPVEVKFYFALPLLVLVFAFALRRNAAAFLVVAAAAIAVNEYMWAAGIMSYRSIQLRHYMPVFVTGFCAALLFERFRDSPQRIWSRVLLEAVSIASLAAVTLTLPAFYRLVTGVHVADYSMAVRHYWYGIGWSAFLLTLMLSRGPVSVLLASRPARFIGLISFSVYLWHLPIIEYVRRTFVMTPPAKVLVVLALLFPAAALSYLVIERPFINLGARLSKRYGLRVSG